MRLTELMEEQPRIKTWVEHEGIRFLKRLGIGEGECVVDFGCGTGGYTVPAVKVVGQGGEVFALDNNEEQIQLLEQDLSNMGLLERVHLKATEGEVTIAGIQDDSVDAMLLFDVLQHVPAWSQLFYHVYRVLKPDGRLCINPSWLSHPGKVDPNELNHSLVGEGYAFGKVGQRREDIMHYEHTAEDEVLVYRPDGS